MRNIEDLKTTNDSRVYKMLRRKYTLSCDRCRPNRNENWKENRLRSWKNWRKDQYKMKPLKLRTHLNSRWGKNLGIIEYPTIPVRGDSFYLDDYPSQVFIVLYRFFIGKDVRVVVEMQEETIDE